MSVSERMSHLLRDGTHSDIDIIVGLEDKRQSFPAHKLILAMSSPVFDAMFYGEMADKSEEIVIPDVTPDSFETFLCYLYTDDVKFGNLQLALDTIYVARKYLVTHLERECVSYVTQELCPQNICQIYECACVMELDSILAHCNTLIKCNITEILCTQDFLQACQSTVKSFISIPGLDVLEGDVFKAIVKWGKEECKRRNLTPNIDNIRAVINPLLSEIWFLRMTPTEFVSAVAETEILTVEEVAYILIKLVCPDAKPIFEWPKRFILSMKT